MHRRLTETRLGKALPRRVEHSGESGVQTEADIGRPAGSFAENPARAIGEPGAALRPAAIDAEKEIGNRFASGHALLLPESSPNWLNTPKFE